MELFAEGIKSKRLARKKMYSRTSIVIPNFNGIDYIKKCLDAVRCQKRKADLVIMIDNGSSDGSAELVAEEYPEVVLVRFPENTGFCGAVNRGIEISEKAGMDYVILLNNDTEAEPDFTGELIRAMDRSRRIFSAQAKMLRMSDPSLIDDAGDFYCALGWAFARGRGKPEEHFRRKIRIFSACAGAAIYRISILREIGLFDEVHFAYLEDCDIGWRAAIEGYLNIFVPTARVKHVGSASSGSVYNLFKVKNSSRNSVYLIAKNMPLPQILINLPLLIPGFFVKAVFFASKHYGKEYLLGIGRGLMLGVKTSSEGKKVRFRRKNLPNYVRIQLELWGNLLRRTAEFFGC